MTGSKNRSSDGGSGPGITGSLRLAWKEGLVILSWSVFLGLAYTAITQQGLFGRSTSTPLWSLQEERAPEIITVQEAGALHFSGKAIFIDTRGDPAYRIGHISGAINIPLSELEPEVDFLKDISSEKVIVPYCDGGACHSSKEFSIRLMAAGISNVKVFFGGWEEWTAARLPTAISQS